jgi:predicted permease
MFMNSNSMPIALMQSLTSSVGDLKRTANDTAADMMSRALTYLILYSTLGNIARWSLGVKILEKADEGAPEVVATAKQKNRDIETSAVVVDVPKTVDITRSRSPSDATMVGRQTISRVPSSSRFFMEGDDDDDYYSRPGELSRTHSFLDSTEPRQPLSAKSSSATLVPLTFSSLSYTTVPAVDKSFAEPPSKLDVEPKEPQPPVSLLRRMLRTLKKIWLGFYDFMTMPLWAAFFSIIIAMIPPVQNIFANHTGPLRQALEQAGGCSIPLTLVVLGAYFYTPPPEGSPKRSLKERVLGMFKRLSKQRKDQQEPVPVNVSPPIPRRKRTVAVAIAARMLFCPLIVIPMLLAFIKGDFPAVFSE